MKKKNQKTKNENNLKNVVVKAAKVYLAYKALQILGFVILMIIIMRSSKKSNKNRNI